MTVCHSGNVHRVTSAKLRDKMSAPTNQYVVLLSGTHVTGKETLALTLSPSLGCSWIKAEMAHAAADFGACSQEKKGYDYSEVFGRIWVAKLQRLGFPPTEAREDGLHCAALLTVYAMRRPGRDAIRNVLLAQSIKPIFVIMHITTQTLSGRTLGAEEPELAERIMAAKIADIEEPQEDEKDVILIDSMRDVDTLFDEIKAAIRHRLAEL